MPTFPTATPPTDSDIQSFVTNSGVLVPSTYSFAGLGKTALQAWQRMTGRTPFIATGTPFALPFDPPGSIPNNRAYGFTFGGGRTLPIKPGIPYAAISSAVVTVGGTAKTLNKDYRFLPLDGAATGFACDLLEFFYPIWGIAGAVVITADFGWSDTIDEDIWYAIVRTGAAIAARDILQGIASSPNLIQIGEDKLQQTPFQNLGTAWQSEADRSAAFYSFKMWGL